MKMDGCSVLTMDGLLMALDHAKRFLRHQQKVQKLVLSIHCELALQSFQLWSPKGFSLCGLMRRDGRNP